MSDDDNTTETGTFVLYPNPAFGHGLPSGERGTVTIEGRRLTAVRQPGRIWVQVIGEPDVWFAPYSALTRATFEAQ
ncbi:hypothetical protein [Kribbella sp. NPDC048928]|uniref:hypothetical protein n=1 Tax=Kribbella sp. NPDC048928 TaxID=3364111 RepID=UPI00371DED11